MKKLEAIWQLEGMFTNTSSMHIGDGGARPNPMLDEEGKSRGEVQTAAKASGGRARIPGTALKGVLRSNAIAPNLLFGTEEKGSTGGTVVFLDAFSEEPV